MQIRKRLKVIASFIEPETSVIDVGCDHALLDIYLTLFHKNQCIACDIHTGALKKAQDNIEKYRLTEQIPIILSDGLEQVPVLSNSTLVITGMGTETVKHILEHPKVKQIDIIVLQSNNELSKLRRFVVTLGFEIVKEAIVCERGIYYVVMKWKRGKAHYSKFEYEFGPYLKKYPVSEKQAYIKYLQAQNQQILACLPNYERKERHKRKWLLRKLKQVAKREQRDRSKSELNETNSDNKKSDSLFKERK